MTISEQTQQKAIHQILLAYNNMSDLLAERRNPLSQLPHFLRNFLRRFHMVWSDTYGCENVRSRVPANQCAELPIAEGTEIIPV